MYQPKEMINSSEATVATVTAENYNDPNEVTVATVTEGTLQSPERSYSCYTDGRKTAVTPVKLQLLR